MGTSQSQQIYMDETQNIVNTVNLACNVDTNQMIQNVTYNISDVFDLGGGIKLDNQVTYPSNTPACNLISALDTDINNYVSTSTNSDMQKGLLNLLGVDVSKSSTSAELKQNIITAINQKCQTSTNQDISGVTLNVTKSTFNGPIEVSNRSSGGGCVIDLTARLNAIASGKATADQMSNSSLFGGLFGDVGNLILFTIITIIGLVILVVIIKALSGGEEGRREEEEGRGEERVVEEQPAYPPMGGGMRPSERQEAMQFVEENPEILA